jgi:outer membrane lipopolysaccharide assembly protein LptE/RlpB
MTKILTVIFFIIVTGCGFKTVNLSETNNFNISEITSTGDKKINYIIKNKLISNTNNDSIERLKLTIDSVKTKTIKERNIKNEITKYKVSVKVLVNVNSINKDISNKISITEDGEYNVDSQNATNRNKEKNLITSLSQKIANKILNEINIYLNDL